MGFLSSKTYRRYQLKAVLLFLSCCSLSPGSLMFNDDQQQSSISNNALKVTPNKNKQLDALPTAIATCCLSHGSQLAAQTLQQSTTTRSSNLRNSLTSGWTTTYSSMSETCCSGCTGFQTVSPERARTNRFTRWDAPCWSSLT